MIWQKVGKGVEGSEGGHEQCTNKWSAMIDFNWTQIDLERNDFNVRHWSERKAFLSLRLVENEKRRENNSLLSSLLLPFVRCRRRKKEKRNSHIEVKSECVLSFFFFFSSHLIFCLFRDAVEKSLLVSGSGRAASAEQMSFNAGDSRSISIGQPVRPTRRSEDSSINDQICAHLISTFVSMAITNEFLSLVRSILPFICLLGSAPTFFIFWLPLRLSSLIFFSQRIYRRYDDFLYSMYQRTVLFFFEHWTKTKVRSSSLTDGNLRFSSLQIYFHGDAKRIFVKKENVLYLSNHQSSGRSRLSSFLGG